MASELNDKVIAQYITGSVILTSVLSRQLGISSDELVVALTDSPKWSVGQKTGKWTLSINGKKLIANPSTDERRIDFITK